VHVNNNCCKDKNYQTTGCYVDEIFNSHTISLESKESIPTGSA
jgi:hypothetical protein